MARTTPAQNPRGAASKIFKRGKVILVKCALAKALSSQFAELPEKGHHALELARTGQQKTACWRNSHSPQAAHIYIGNVCAAVTSWFERHPVGKPS